MSKPRAVITGIGVVSSIGLGKEAFWQSLIAGRSGIKPIRGFDASGYLSQIAGEIWDFAMDDLVPCNGARLCRAAQMALAATQMAIEDAHLNWQSCESHRCGVAMGTALGGADVYEQQLRRLNESDNPRRVNPLSVPLTMANASAAEIALRYGLKGPNMTLSTACSSGAHAIGHALHLIRSQKVDWMIAGGAEAGPLIKRAMVLCSARAPRSWCWKAWSSPAGEAPRSTPKSRATALPAKPTTSSIRKSPEPRKRA